jgi:hypothetical protein
VNAVIFEYAPDDLALMQGVPKSESPGAVRKRTRAKKANEIKAGMLFPHFLYNGSEEQADARCDVAEH